MDKQEFYADNLVKHIKPGETIIKYFQHKQRTLYASHSVPEVYETEKEINEYADNHGLKIISSSCDRDNGVYVTFEAMD